MIPDNYELRGLLGQGGMSEVRLAWDRKLQREVALKSARGTAATVLLHEAQVLQRIRHAGIPVVYAFGSASGESEAWMAMEVARGESLEAFVDREVMSVAEFVPFAEQALEALGAAHEQGVLHLDLKPDNIFIYRDAEDGVSVKILDFGCARSEFASALGQDLSGAVMGSLFFMAPERFDRLPCDARSDLYSLGCVFYFALSGLAPFFGDTAPQVMVAHLRHLMVPLRERRPDIDPSLTAWVESLMQRHITARPMSAAAALELLRERRQA